MLDEVRRGNLELGARRARPRRRRATGQDANGDEIETPFLQLVMTRLWECERAQGSAVLRTTTLDESWAAPRRSCATTSAARSPGCRTDELEAATDIFRDLVTPSGVKVAHTAADLAQMTGHVEARSPRSSTGSMRSGSCARSIRRPAPREARYEIFHDRLAAPILDWRDEQENARLEQAGIAPSVEAETQRTQARRFKRRARIMLGLALGLLVLLVAVVVLLTTRAIRAPPPGASNSAALRDSADGDVLRPHRPSQLAAPEPAGRFAAAGSGRLRQPAAGGRRPQRRRDLRGGGGELPEPRVF